MGKRRKRSGKGGAVEVAAKAAQVVGTEASFGSGSGADPRASTTARQSLERISEVPPESLEAHDAFVRSPVAVLESLRIHVPAVVAAHARRSTLPPPASVAS
jgi:hypothetical protein